MSDIVDRLRERECKFCDEAVVEIEQLRAALSAGAGAKSSKKEKGEMTDNESLANRLWGRIQANLEDRGVLHLDNVDDPILEEIEAEQVAMILEELEAAQVAIILAGLKR